MEEESHLSQSEYSCLLLVWVTLGFGFLTWIISTSSTILMLNLEFNLLIMMEIISFIDTYLEYLGLTSIFHCLNKIKLHSTNRSISLSTCSFKALNICALSSVCVLAPCSGPEISSSSYLCHRGDFAVSQLCHSVALSIHIYVISEFSKEVTLHPTKRGVTFEFDLSALNHDRLTNPAQ